MAKMIPADGGDFNVASGEERMFLALKQLPDDYYVFHSYRVVELIPGKGLNENEIVKSVLSQVDMWGEDLNELANAHELVSAYLTSINEKGMKDALISFLNK